jgi:hypothetical protein
MLRQDRLITGIYFRYCFSPKIIRLSLEKIHAHKIVFQLGDIFEDSGGRKIGGVKLAVFDSLLDALTLVRRVIHAKARLYTRLIGVPAKDSNAQRVEGADVSAAGRTQSNRSLAHLIGGFIGESYRTNIVRLDA